MAVLAVAAISCRLLAEAAARDGFGVVAMDVYGDVDTRRAATRWLPIGAADASQLDASRVLEALQELSHHRGADEVIGWIPGSGFEGRPEVLAAGAQLLPLIGTAAGDVRRLRGPGRFFGALAALGIAHPPTQARPPADRGGWLSKDANGCGGWHIVPAAGAPDSAPAGTSRYFQRAVPGTPMSATFIGNGRDALLLGFNELIVRPFAAHPQPHPYVYCGCVGPVTVTPEVARQIGTAVHLLTAEFGLRGWCSLDFVRDGDDIAVLEVNPRPPASMALYPSRGRIEAQLRACLHSELPTGGVFVASSTAGSRIAGTRIAGTRIVYARRSLQLDAAAARRLANWPDAHDLPAAGACFEPGDPLCSLTAEDHGAEHVQALLSARHDALLDMLDTSHFLDERHD